MLEHDLINSVTSEKLKELASEGAEVALDNFLSDGVLKDIPIFGSLYKIYQAGHSIRDAIFAKKVFRFLTGLKDIPSSQRKAFIEKMDGSEIFNHRVGEKLIVILDRLDDLDKPTIIARLFNATVCETIKFETFLKLASIVDKAFLPELLRLNGEVDHRGFFYTERNFTKETIEHFYTIGIFSMTIKDDKMLKRIQAEATIGGKPKDEFVPRMEYEINKIGEKLVKFGMMEHYVANQYDMEE